MRIAGSRDANWPRFLSVTPDRSEWAHGRRLDIRKEEIHMMNVRRLLGADHENFLTLFAALQDAVDGADQPTIQAVWSEFEQRLMTHIDAEEAYLLPGLERAHPEAIARARTEHARIRTLLAELGIQTDLHILRKSAAGDLVALLRNHAAWEDETLYQWAETELSAEPRRSLLDRVARVWKRSEAKATGAPLAKT
jgi:hemerythrin